MLSLSTRSTGLSVIASILLSLPAIAASKYHKGVVEKESDGDTIWVTVSGPGKAPRNEMGNVEPTATPKKPDNRMKIRMVGMDTPETHLPTPKGVVSQGKYGDLATEALAEKIPVGTKVTVEDLGKDKYERVLGRLFEGKRDINLEMVADGWAVPYIICEGTGCTEDFFDNHRVEEYFAACESARSEGLGIFDRKDPLKEMPFEFRLRMQNRKADKWVGDYFTGKLYEPTDYKKVDLCARVFFMKKADAVKVGFEP